jgi:hypothetical protein
MELAMGYDLRCFVTPCDDDAEASAILAAAAEAFPWAKRKRFRAPWAGVIAGADPAELYEDYEEHPDRYPFADADSAYEVLYEGVEGCLKALSMRFPARSFAYIEVMCFGGVCQFSGHVVRAGEVTTSLRGSTGDGHVTLLKAAGAPQDEWHFEPFTRGFFEDDHAPSEVAERRRGIQGEIRGELRGYGLGALAIHLAGALPAPWQVSKMVKTILVSYGPDDVLFSLNGRPDGSIDVGGRTHVDKAEAARLLDDFVRMGPGDLEMAGSITLLDREKAVLRAWRLDQTGG